MTRKTADSLQPMPVFLLYSQWVATLQTNQKALDKNNVVEASKSLQAFSMPSEKQAVYFAKAWTPPRMFSFACNKFCHICASKFAIFRRACHCRNCGVCICKDCAVQWPSKMVPDTYNIKRENFVNVCKSCNWLCNSFRRALLEGLHDQVVALYATGNVNIHTSFANVKGELFFPVHCAVLGGNIELLKFLVDELCCPIKTFHIASNARNSKSVVTPIVTSKGRSLLGIAMNHEKLDIVRYLVTEKGVSLTSEKDVTTDMLCRCFEKTLRLTPQELLRSDPLSILPTNRLDNATGLASYDFQPTNTNNPETARIISESSVDAEALAIRDSVLESAAGDHGDEDQTNVDECKLHDPFPPPSSSSRIFLTTVIPLSFASVSIDHRYYLF
jgi:FYVE zinc finger